MPKTTTMCRENKYVLLLYSNEQTDSEVPEETIFFSSEMSLGLVSLMLINAFNDGTDIPFRNLPLDTKLFSKEKSEIRELDDYFNSRAYVL